MNQTPDPAGVRVLVVEDNTSYRTLLVRRLGKRGYIVEGVDSEENPNAPFDHPFHMILNVAVGGNLPGAPDATTVFPQRMEVDYVRVYERTQ